MDINKVTVEQAVMAGWDTKKDIDLFLSQYLDGPTPMTPDEVANYMMGVSAIHNARMHHMWVIVERLVVEYESLLGKQP